MRSTIVTTMMLVVFGGFFGTRSHAADDVSLADRLLGAERVLFLGDSITFAGQYITIVETELRLSDEWTSTDGPWLLNLGLGSEGVTGLSEPGHPFPRPNVHERLQRALDKFAPDLVVACYGMNDGIYHPFSDERFAAYRDGINRLIAAVDAADATLVLCTPPPFDPMPLRRKGKLRPADADVHSWTGVYENYDDEVIARYGEWILDQRDRVAAVVDLHTPINAYLAERRVEQPGFAMSNDGVHPNDTGHAVIAAALLGRDDVPTFEGERRELMKAVSRRQRLLRDAWLSHVGHKRPKVKPGLPIDEATSQAAEIATEIDELVRNLKGS